MAYCVSVYELEFMSSFAYYSILGYTLISLFTMYDQGHTTIDSPLEYVISDFSVTAEDIIAGMKIIKCRC